MIKNPLGYVNTLVDNKHTSASKTEAHS